MFQVGLIVRADNRDNAQTGVRFFDPGRMRDCVSAESILLAPSIKESHVKIVVYR
jgi:hypothetical protein